MAEITKRKFDNATKKYPPAKWIKFAFKYFSKSTEKKNMKLSNGFAWFLGGAFLFGFFATVLKLPRPIIAVTTVTFVSVLTLLVLFLLAAVLMNNRRIKKIAKHLGVSLQEYNKLADKYYESV
jgi:VIT1/CCC1 family predicted Fe2+/Mn2+ transporter